MAVSGFDVPPIDDPHDASVDGNLRREKRERRLAAPHEENMLTHPRARGIGSDQRPAGCLTIRCHGLQDEELVAVERRLLQRGDDVADDAGQLHVQSLISMASTTPTIAASTGQSFSPAAMRAELPLTIRTVSPYPASTVSTATR